MDINRKRKKIKIILIILISLIALGGISFGGYEFYDKVYLEKISSIKMKLKGDKNLEIELGEEYVEKGATAKFRKKDLTKDIKVTGNVDNTKIGKYEISYTVSTKKKTKKLTRTITVVDKVNPEIKLKGDSTFTLYLDNEYVEPGFTATDNYDGDITENVKTQSNVNKSKIGTYEVEYTVSDQSGNSTSIKRTVKVVNPFKALPDKNAKATKIAVLNYHFFYDATKGNKGDGNYTSIQTFEEQLKYLKDNDYKTLTMEEFRAWMYGERDLPARSVLITVDDGGNGTGKKNGNLLIPILEKYQAHATIFLITGWWDKNGYISPYVDLESHTDEMHESNYCSGVSRGAKMLCLSDEEVIEDLTRSTNYLGSKTAFCYPFYAHTAHTMELLKQVGFKLAFIGGESKATRSTNKYKIPRYHMYKTTTLVQFNHMIA